MDITPKCKYGDTLFVTPFGTLRPCCWVPEQMCWKTFDIDPNWNVDMTPVNDTSLFNATQKMVVDDDT